MIARASGLAAVLLCAPAAALAAMTDSEARRLAELSLEDLMQVEVTTVAAPHSRNYPRRRPSP